MALWYKHELRRNDDEVDDEGEEVKPFEDQVLDALKDLTDRLAKLERRMDKIEKISEDRVKGLEDGLRSKGEYIEMLLARLLDKDYVVASIGKSNSSGNSHKVPTGVQQPPSLDRAKLNTPVGKLP